ncbi:MAG TPA: ABC transporter substrate-binding protein [Longimicrobiales bacterium]
MRGRGGDPAAFRRIARSRGAAWVCVYLALAACGEGGRRDAAAGDGAPVRGGTLVIASPTDLDYANPLVSGEVLTHELLRNALLMPLIRYDTALEYQPWLARSWEMLGDTGVVFHLRDDVYWHDGVRTTAYDVAFTYERAIDPETAFPNVGNFFAHWGAVEVLDSFTVRFSFEPHVDPLASLPFFAIVPRHVLDSIPPARLREARFNTHPVGNGPFRFVERRPNDRWIFEANPDFPEELGGRPYVDRLVWRVIPESTGQIAELLSGHAHLVVSPPGSQLRELDARPGIHAVVRPSRQYQFIVWNGRRAPFDDPRVRRALMMGMDRQEILTVLRGGYGQLAAGPIYPSHWAYPDSIAPLPFDPAAARALLAEVGFTDRNGDGTVENADGTELRFALTIPAAVEFGRNVAEMVQADLAAIGVEMSVRAVDGNTMIANLLSPQREFDAALLAWEGDLRLNLVDTFHSSALGQPFQMASYSNAEVDRLLDRATTVTDRAAAIPIWHRIQAIMRDEQPWGFFFYVPDLFLASDRLHGVEMDIRGPFITLPWWWLADGGGAGDTVVGED